MLCYKSNSGCFFDLYQISMVTKITYLFIYKLYISNIYNKQYQSTDKYTESGKKHPVAEVFCPILLDEKTLWVYVLLQCIIINQ